MSDDVLSGNLNASGFIPTDWKWMDHSIRNHETIKTLNHKRTQDSNTEPEFCAVCGKCRVVM